MNYFERYLESLYTPNNVILQVFGRPTVAEQDELNAFHAQKVIMVERKDDYFLGARADHFVVELGWSEEHFLRTGEPYEVFLIGANHKGTRSLVLLRGMYPAKIG